MNTCFYDWAVARYAGNDSPTGDFATDMAYDLRFPRTDDKDAIANHLRNCGACDGAMKAFERAWGYYKKAKRMNDTLTGGKTNV